MLGIKKKKKSCKLKDCPVGLFFPANSNELCLKTEYGLDAYIVSSGEKFWGGTKTQGDLADIEVIPCKLID